jgi:hypothetical protein
MAGVRDLGDSLLTRDIMNSSAKHPKVSDGNSEPHQSRDPRFIRRDTPERIGLLVFLRLWSNIFGRQTAPVGRRG